MTERGAATDIGAVKEARMLALQRACEVLAAEMKLVSFHGPVRKLTEAERQFDLAARDLTNANDELPPDKRWKGWNLGPDGEVA